jgi:cellulose 1,4-beta-cellobiosidase
MNAHLGHGFVVSLMFAVACAAAQPTTPATPAEPEAPAGQWSNAPDDPVIEPIKAMPVEPAKGPHAPADKNPFAGAKLYVNPDYMAKVEATAKEVPEIAPQIKKLGKVPTGMWLESLGALKHLPRWLDDAAKQEKAAGGPLVPVFLIYNLPNRDCSAKSSAGELTVENDGERRYRVEFIDEIAKQFAARPNQKIVAILEPDSLPNIATNLSVEKCAKSEHVYRNSVAYAISKLSLPNVSLYLDAAHAGWLGWDGNRSKIAQIFKEVLDAAGGHERIRGFATNVANYTAIEGEANLKLESSNPAPNEHLFVEKLNASLEAVGIKNKGFIIDTSRNGKDGVRQKWGNWCNIKGMGLGERPRINPRPLIDAYLWVKPPGESDGTAERGAPRFDESCVSVDSDPAAPQAGEWFKSYFVGLVKNANPPL